MLLFALFASATIAINLEESSELPLENAVKMVDALAAAIGARAGAEPVVDDPTWSGCKREDRCLIDIAARTQAKEVVLVRVYGGAISHRMIAERFRDGASLSRAEIKIPERADEWRAVFEEAAARLFPNVEKRAVENAAFAPPVQQDSLRPRGVSPWPFVAAGAGVAVLVVGIVFGVNSANARDRLETEILPEPEHNALYRSSTRDQHLANGFFAGAAALAGAGVVLFVID